MVIAFSPTIRLAAFGVARLNVRFLRGPSKAIYGIFKTDGMKVHRGDVLVSQRTVDYFPGLNVNITHNKSLTALTDGMVIISREKVDLDFDDPWIREQEGYREGIPISKLVFNVVADEPPGKFRLVDEV